MVDTKPLVRAFAIAPAAAGSDSPATPTAFFTAMLEGIRRELNRLFNNKAPTAVPVQISQSGAGVVSGSVGATDPEGDPLRYKVTQIPARGTVVVDAAGNFIYTPDSSLAASGGTDTFVVQVRDVGFRLNWWSPTRITAPVTVTITAPTHTNPDPTGPTDPGHGHHDPGGGFVDLATFGTSNGSDHTGHDGLVGGRTAITTEALLAYNHLRQFAGLAPATLDQVGAWAFANGLTNNSQAWGNDQQGVGLWYAMQGAKVGWIADDAFDPQILADIQRTARLGSAADVMAMVAQHGHSGFANFLTANGFDVTFINTLKMEPHYAGWMHDRAHGRLSIEGVATAHDVNHLTVLSHDQTQPFMNDTWDWPQWPALEVTHERVLEYFQSMVVLGNPLGHHLNNLTGPPGQGSPTPGTLPSLSIADLSVAEGNGEHSHFMFMVTLNKASTSPISLGYSTSNGTATAGSDYTAASGALTFAPGATSQTVHVDIIGDSVVEGNETFTVTLTSPNGATLSKATATGTITNDDVAPVSSLSISDASVVEGNPGGGAGIAAGYLSTLGNQIVDSAGNTVKLAGVNWFGGETSNGVPHGLWTRGYKSMIDQMVTEGFNTIRLPFSNEMLHSSAAPTGIDYFKNPELQGLSRLQVMDEIIRYAGEKNMRVILDQHRSAAGNGPNGNGLWYEGAYTEDKWVADWQLLANRYKGNSTVIGVDLANEPHNGTWGGGGATDWARAAERAGNAVLAVNPNLLIIVEGVETYQGQNYWWGGNLMGVKDRPIVLNVPNRVVYSPHDYPNSVYAQPWFQQAGFAAGLPDKFEQMWGYIYEQNIAPIMVGEFGTKLVDPKDEPWFEAITSYMSGDFDNNGTIDIASGLEGVSFTYWSWNPNSGDTGGILADDWTTVNQNKMVYLEPIQYSTDSGGNAVARFTVTLAAPSATPVSVQYATSNGTAAAGSDYIATAGTITFAPGVTTQTVEVQVLPDTLVEPNETFTVTLSNPTGATITDATAAGTITNDDTGSNAA
ncbi:MAG: cellulase family glycosylhydrolase [Mycolicibacterium sp.]|uniref:cellulase family glycosylhydrolase n=1 Tax=Mycolicibacterium sp. TaxID=2320850 RepID=UPI003D0D0889